jgi:hypothetical protein
MSKKIVVLLFSCIIFLLSCNTTEPPPPVKTFTLTLEDAASIEAWIKLTTTNLQLPATITLKQNNQTRNTINLVKADTLLYIDSLLPNQSYTFQAITQSSNQSITSNELSVTTMDTTSHNINWEAITIGDAGSFALDVAIISENDIWIGGEFYVNDTLYNAANWDGQQWNLKRIPAVPWFNPDIVVYDGIRSLLAFASDDIWFSEELGTIVHWDGNSYESFIIGANQAQGTILEMWGHFSNEIYLVGTNGSLTKFNGSSFSLMNSGTDINLTDIYDTPDGGEIWACGRETGQRSIILRLRGNVWERIWEKDIFNPDYIYNNSSIKTIWLDNQFFAWFTGAALGVYRQIYSHNSVIDHSVFNNQNAFHRVRGSSSNNIIAVGDDAMVWHFNGNSWHWYDTLFNEESVLLSVDVKNNLIVAIGSSTANLLTNALVLVGRN